MFNFRLYFRCLFHLYRLKKRSEFRISAKRIFILFLFFTFYSLHTLINWLFSLIDEILFFRYRKTPVINPVFITGAPRTGTTFMHRSLAEDRKTFTSFTLGEILFAPSIVQKYIINVLSLIDRKLKSPGRRIIRFFEKVLGGSYEKIHRYSLLEADEDEILMISIFSSMYLMFLFPEDEKIRKYAHFDEMVPEKEKSRIMKYYLKSVRKHLWFSRRGDRSGPVYLAKSPVFVSKMSTIRSIFPECRIIYVKRDTEEVLPSWISMNATVFRIFHSPVTDYPLKEETAELLSGWLHKADEMLSQIDPGSVFIAGYRQFAGDPAGVIRNIYSYFRFDLTGEYQAILGRIGESQKNYRSGHRYSLDEMGIEPVSLKVDQN